MNVTFLIYSFTFNDREFILFFTIIFSFNIAIFLWVSPTPMAVGRVKKIKIFVFSFNYIQVKEMAAQEYAHTPTFAAVILVFQTIIQKIRLILFQSALYIK